MKKTEAGAAPGRATLEAAFRATGYRVVWDGASFVLRLGACHADFDAHLEQHHCRSWAIVTAANPGAQLLSGNENAVRAASLLADLATRGWAAYPACNVADAGDWPEEPSVLLPGRSEAEAAALARAYGQLACVCGEVGQAARLVWVLPAAEEENG